MNHRIDLNCDLGEGLDNEHLLMPYLSSCNISCGAHAGSIEIMDKVISLALEHGVKIGAHPSFPDQKHFGRRVMDISDYQLHENISEQLQLFKERADKQDAPVNHVKPHGALYNLVAVNKEKADILVNAVERVFDKVKIYLPYKSDIEKVALKRGIDVVYEAFADRNYNDDLSLVPRSLPQAILAKEKIIEHVKRMVKEQKVKTIQGHEVEIKADTFCIHGDNPDVLDILAGLHKEFSVK